MPLHPQVEGFLKQLEALGARPFHSMPPAECRQAFTALLDFMPKSQAAIAGSVDRRIAGPGGEIPLRVYTPQGQGPFPALVYFHGGGFVIGDLDGYDSNCRELCASVGCVVVSVDYRLAPEHKFPAAPDDCFAATRWVAAHAGEIGVDPARIAVGGDSAGGNLAAVVAQRARNEGGPALCGQLLIYPVVQVLAETPSLVANAEGYLLTRADMEWFFAHYARSPADGEHPQLAPLLAPDLSALPPALVLTCEFDPLRDEGEDYARALADAGVPTQTRRLDGTIHGSWNFFMALEPGRSMMDDASAWLRARFAS